MAVPLSLRAVVDQASKNGSIESLKKVSASISEWTVEYYSQMGKYEAQTMPDKWKSDTLGSALSRILDEQ